MTQHDTHNTHNTPDQKPAAPNKHTHTRQALDMNKLSMDTARHRQPFTLSRNPDKAMQEMMDTISALRHVYEQENEALENASTREFMALFDKKIRIARQYEDGVKQMIERRDEFKGVNPDLKQKLYAEQEEFSSLTSKNLKALKRMRKSVERLSDRIMSVARDVVKKDSVNYGASGSLTEQKRAVSIGLNESA